MFRRFTLVKDLINHPTLKIRDNLNRNNETIIYFYLNLKINS